MLIAVVPQKYIPERLTPFVAAEGRFTGEAIRLAVPRSESPDVGARLRIRMDQGTCSVSFRQGPETTLLFRMGTGDTRRRVPSGSELILNPKGDEGSFEVILGPELHPLTPGVRHFVLLPIAVCMLVTLVLARKIGTQATKLGGKRLPFLVGVAASCALVLYPVLHEGGHMISGVLFGGVPNWDSVEWTSVSGERPHASFSYLPTAAIPFMTAGGTLVPLLVALLLLTIWAFTHRKASWYVSATLVTIAGLLLFSTLGCLFELYQNTHMDALAVHFELVGPLRVAFSLSPLIVSIAVYVWIGMILRTPTSKDAKGSKRRETLNGGRNL